MASRDVAVVPVRAGSKGLPGKNTRPFVGQPLYLRAVHQGLRCVSACVVSTDDPAVLNASMPQGCHLHQRPAQLAQDSTPMAPVLKDVILACGLEDARLVLLQATTPLRDDSDIAQALSLHETGDYDTVLSVRETNPTILKYGTLQGAEFTAVSSPDYCFSNRQDLPSVYAPNGAVYVFSAADFLKAGAIPSARMGAVVMSVERSYDIDTREDF
ncbi:MAG: acylneuraminate cytidylyltransferase family protein, partial [Pseudomonadota bacterium]